MKRRIVILGNGIAGITAARHVRKKSDDEILVISAESDHFFSRTALMYIYMGHMTYAQTKPYEDSFWKRNRIGLRRARVKQVDPAKRCLVLDGGETLSYDVLVLATGSQSRRFDWPGQELRGVQGLYSVQDLESMERDTRDIRRGVVVGGGLIGIETAEMLLAREIPVTFLVREPGWMSSHFPAEESEMIGRHIREHGVDLRLSTELERILPDDEGRVRAVCARGTAEEIACGFVALTIGVSPNVAFLEGCGIECDRGVLVDEYLRTNVEDVYAIGDCAQLREAAPGRRPVEAVWYAGRAMGETLARTLTGSATRYVQGIWFNSAKFFDLEWQIYGSVPAQLPEGRESLFWMHPEGKKSIRIHYRTEDRAVVGFNLIGIRYRHDTCAAWIERESPIETVLEHLGAANFDPETYSQHEAELVAEFNRRHPQRPVTLRTRRGLAGWLRLAGMG